MIIFDAAYVSLTLSSPLYTLGNRNYTKAFENPMHTIHNHHNAFAFDLKVFLQPKITQLQGNGLQYYS